MEIDAALSAKLAELKKQLEGISGQKIDASPEQLFPLFFRVSLASSEDGTILSRGLIFPGTSCSQASALPANLLDVSSRSTTGADGKAVFLLSNFICSTVNSFAEPVNVVVTPNAATPCYATMTHVLVPKPNAPGVFNDLQITVFTWTPNGTVAPNISFDWRCRLLSIVTIL
jgi:hypothetical protein